MPRIDQWVVRNTLAWLGDWVRQHGAAAATFALNVSGASLSDERFRQDLQTLLEAVRLPADTLCFEIKETAAIAKEGLHDRRERAKRKAHGAQRPSHIKDRRGSEHRATQRSVCAAGCADLP